MMLVSFSGRHASACLLLWTILSHAAAAEPPITALAFAPDGQSVVAASQAGLQLLNWPDLAIERKIELDASNVHCLAFSPSEGQTGYQLAVGGGAPAVTGSVEIFSWPETVSQQMWSRHEDSIMALAWRSDSELVTASLDRGVHLWDLNTNETLRAFQGHSRGVIALSVLPDLKTMVSAGEDQSLRVWDLDSGELVRSLNQHTSTVHALALRPGEGGLPMVASAAGDRTIRFWQPTIGRMVRFIRLDAEPLNIAWLNDGSRIAAACVDGRVRVIDADNVTVTETMSAIEGWAYAIAVHPTDGSLLVGGAGGQLQRLQAAAPRPE
jgi:WD40 repeat protein